MKTWMRWTAGLAGVAAALLVLGAGAVKVAGRERADAPRDCQVGAASEGAQTLQLRSSDGLCLQAYLWQPAGPPRATLLLVHGLQDHALRHAALARQLQQRGVAVLAYDQRGHGRSGGAPQRIDSLAVALDDLQRAAATLQERHPGLPRYLHGHSFGGLMVAHQLARDPDLAGAVLSSAALQRPDAVDDGAERFVARLAHWAPNLGLDGLQAERLLREPQAQAALMSDPLISHQKLPARTVDALLKGLAALPKAPSPVPQLLLHGEADALTPPGGSRAWAARQPSAQLQLYPQARHDLQNEPEGAQLRERVTVFVLQESAKGG
jgi:acylglycerol lipase